MLDKQFDRTQTLFDQPNGAKLYDQPNGANYMMTLFDAAKLFRNCLTWTEQKLYEQTI